VQTLVLVTAYCLRLQRAGTTKWPNNAVLVQRLVSLTYEGEKDDDSHVCFHIFYSNLHVVDLLSNRCPQKLRLHYPTDGDQLNYDDVEASVTVAMALQVPGRCYLPLYQDDAVTPALHGMHASTLIYRFIPLFQPHAPHRIIFTLSFLTVYGPNLLW